MRGRSAAPALGARRWPLRAAGMSALRECPIPASFPGGVLGTPVAIAEAAVLRPHRISACLASTGFSSFVPAPGENCRPGYVFASLQDDRAGRPRSHVVRDRAGRPGAPLRGGAWSRLCARRRSRRTSSPTGSRSSSCADSFAAALTAAPGRAQSRLPAIVHRGPEVDQLVEGPINTARREPIPGRACPPARVALRVHNGASRRR